MPTAERSPAVTTICCALFTSSPERPMTSGRCCSTAWISCSDGTLMPRLTTSKPLFDSTMSTRFLPMSCTSPFTVASSTLPRDDEAVFSMCGSRKVTAAFITSADCSTSATISLLSLNSRPTSLIPAISGPLMIASGSP